MPRYCCVNGCSNSVGTHRLPSKEKKTSAFNMEQWLQVIKNPLINTANYNSMRICKLHFTSDCFTAESNRFKYTAFPTMNLPDATPELSDAHAIASTSGEGFDYSTPPESTSNENVIWFRRYKNLQRKHSVLTKKYNNLQRKFKKVKQDYKHVEKRSLEKLMSTHSNQTSDLLKEIIKNNYKKEVASRRTHFSKGMRYSNRFKKLSMRVVSWVSRSAYNHLAKEFGMPSRATIERYMPLVSLTSGINIGIFENLKEILRNVKDDKAKNCILMFDEVSLGLGVRYNKQKDFVHGFEDFGFFRSGKYADHALVFMIQGIFTKYKQPIGFYFSQNSTKATILKQCIVEMITALQEAGFIVRATISDQAKNNVGAIQDLIDATNVDRRTRNATINQISFEINGHVIVHIFDPPHLIKCTRNNLLGKNLKLNNKIASWNAIVDVYNFARYNTDGISPLPKLTEKHVVPGKINKMKVKFATQIFSYSLASIMILLANTTSQFANGDVKTTGEILLYFNNLFDSVNNASDSNISLYKSVISDSVIRYWSECINQINLARYIQTTASGIIKETKPPTLKHWGDLLKSLSFLYEQLKAEYGTTIKIYTRRLNQDPLESFFSLIRSCGHQNTNPTWENFIYYFKKLLFENIVSSTSVGSNCMPDENSYLASFEHLFKTLPDNESDKDVPVEQELVPPVEIYEANLSSFEQTINDNIISTLTIYIPDQIKQCSSCRIAVSHNNELTVIFNLINSATLNILKNDIGKRSIGKYSLGFIKSNIQFDNYICSQHLTIFYEKFVQKCVDIVIENYCKRVNNILRGKDTREINEDELPLIQAKQCHLRHQRRPRHNS